MARRSPSVGPFTIAALTVLALVAIVAVYHVATLPSHQMTVQPAPAIAIDPAAAERLAGAIRIPTVSSQYGGASPDALAQLHLHLAQSFPRTHRTLNRDVLGGSLLYEWRGQDPSLPPLLLLAHLDVVP